MLRIYFIVAWIVLIYAQANNIYQAYDYNDTHYVKTTMEKGISLDSVYINSRLHIHRVENNGTNYDICWLENNTTQTKDKIDINSIYAPFIVENSTTQGFQIAHIKALSRDHNVIERLWGIVDILQFIPNKQGVYRVNNALGEVEVNQTITNNKSYQLNYLAQYKDGQLRNDISYKSSIVTIVPDTNSSLFSEVIANENISMRVSKPKATMEDRRTFKLTKSSNPLPTNHWFLQLGTDISTWGFSHHKSQSSFSLNQASQLFSKKEEEMKSLLDDSKKFAQWVLDNMDFLNHLDQLLETHTLDDKVSAMLFANLGYVDTTDSSNILSRVFLNEDINRKERFRSLMGLKDTSAPMDEDTLDSLIDYGLGSPSDDMLTRASGMLIGTMAKNRAKRVPEEYEKISSAISNAIDTQDDKVVALSAAGNMQEEAPDRVLQSVESVLLSNSDIVNRENSADALSRIKRTNLNVSDFKNLFEQSKSTILQSKLIKSSSVAKDFQSNSSYRNFLEDYSKKRTNPKSNRLASLDVLAKSGFGRTDEEKQEIRKMMVGENDREVSKRLRELYRR